MTAEQTIFKLFVEWQRHSRNERALAALNSIKLEMALVLNVPFKPSPRVNTLSQDSIESDT